MALNQEFISDVIPAWLNLPLGVVITSTIWLVVTFLTKPDEEQTLRKFYKKVKPGGPGWGKIVSKAATEGVDLNEGSAQKWNVPQGIAAIFAGCFFVYSSLFATGYWLYGQTTYALILTLVALVSAWLIKRLWSGLTIL